MNREEAIEHINIAINRTWKEKKCNEILDALKQESCEDCISKQAAIDAIKNYASMLWEKYHEPFPESTIMEMIQALPLVTTRGELPSCESCMNGNQEEKAKLCQKSYLAGMEHSRQEPCEDVISRQAALDCLTATKLKKFDFILQARAEIKKLSSVTPQPREDIESAQVELEGDGYADGEIVYDYGKCPKCGWEFEEGDKDWEEPYCCHCGQKLDWFETQEVEE